MKRLLSAMLSLALCLGLCVPAAGAFSDVEGWAEPYIQRAASLELVSGVGGDRFAPDSQVSYLQYAIMLCAIRYKDESAEAIAANSGEWWQPYCVVAGRHGLFDGTVMASETAWASQNSQPVPRQAMAQMMYNYLKAEDVRLPGDAEKAAAQETIADLAAVEDAYVEAVLTCYSMGLLSGTGSGFSPASSMNRAQAAVVLCAVYDTVMNGADDQPEDTSKPEDASKPEDTSKPEDASKPEDTSKPEDASKPEDVSKPEDASQPEDDSKPEAPSQTDALLANGTAITEENVRAIINGLRSSYPEKMSWTNDNSYTSYALNIRGFGCAAFALLCSDAAFGDLPQTGQHSDFDAIRVGDMLRVMNDTHSVIVLEKRENSVVVAEGNYNNSIHWDREITRQTLESENFYVTTRYPA